MFFGTYQKVVWSDMEFNMDQAYILGYIASDLNFTNFKCQMAKLFKRSLLYS